MSIDEMIEILQAVKDGKEIEYENSGEAGKKWVKADPLAFNFDNVNYRIKPQPTREEITTKWVKDNNIVVGSKVMITGNVLSGVELPSLTNGVVDSINPTSIGVAIGNVLNFYEVESLEPYKEEYVPFTWNDRDLLRGKWVRWKFEDKEFTIDCICERGLCFSGELFTWDRLFKDLEFINGSVFGKLKQ